MDDTPPEPDPDVGPRMPDRTRALGAGGLTLLVAPIIGLVIASNIGNALFPVLSTENPLLLIALNASNRNLVVASQQVAVPAFFAVGFVRLLLPDPFFFLLGRFYGDRAITWMEQRTPTFGRLMRDLEGLFGKAADVLVVVMPNNPVCLLAGASAMPPLRFWILNVVGTIGRLLIMFWIGDTFEGAVNWLLELIAAYRIPLTVLSVGLVGFVSWREWRSGTSEIQQLVRLEDELEHGDGPTGDSDEPAG